MSGLHIDYLRETLAYYQSPDLMHRVEPYKIEEIMQECIRLNRLLDTPQTKDFLAAVEIEVAHQTNRWGRDHDAVKTWADWLVLFSYLQGKLAAALYRGDPEKAIHHVITLAAAASQCHKFMSPGVAGCRHDPA